MQIIGHRGAAGLAPENTVSGIKFAISLDVDWIEFDVHATKDEKVVVIHDATLDRISDKGGNVSDYTFAELHKIATKSGEPIPTIEEVFKAINGRCRINVELKSTGCAPTVVRLINQEVEKGRALNNFLVSSFKVALLREVHVIDPLVPLGLLHDIWPFKFLTTKLQLKAVGFYYMTIPKMAINLAKKRDLFVYAYTVNTKNDAKSMEQKGVDAIVTDVPHNFRAYETIFRQRIFLIVITLLLGVILWLTLR